MSPARPVGVTRPALSPTCRRCGEANWAFKKDSSRFCRPCQRRLDATYRTQKRGPKSSTESRSHACGHPRRPKNRECIVCHDQRAARRGIRLAEQADPDYLAIIRDRLPVERLEAFGRTVTNAAYAYPGRPIRWPRPSEVYPGLPEALDADVMGGGYHRNVAFCTTLSTNGWTIQDQREYFALYRENPVSARHWAALPPWKRPLMNGDADARQIWKYFRLMVIPMHTLAQTPCQWSLDFQGRELGVSSMVLYNIKDIRRLATVLSAYGHALSQGAAPTDLRSPWEIP